MDDQAEFTDEQLNPKAEGAEPPPEEAPKARVPSDLDEGIEHLKHVAVGVAARLFGPKLVNAEPERPTLSPEADKLVEDIGATVGHYLRAAGTALQDPPKDMNEAGKEAKELAREPIRKEVEDGWSPLVQGARAFSVGLGTVMTELTERARERDADKAAEPAEPAASTPPAEPEEP